MSLVNMMDLSLCSKEQKEGFIFPTELPFVFKVNSIYVNPYNGLNKVLDQIYYTNSFYDISATPLILSRGIIVILNSISDNGQKPNVRQCNQSFIIKSNRFEALKEELSNVIRNKSIMIDKLEKDKEYIIFFGKECTISRVAFREFCNTNGINFKITRDVKKANLFIGDFKKQYNILYGAFKEQVRFFNANNRFQSYVREIETVDYLSIQYDQLIRGSGYEIDERLKREFFAVTNIPIENVIEYLNPVELKKTIDTLFNFIKTVEPVLYSGLIADDGGKYTPFGTQLLNIITQSYYRIQNQTNYKVLPETNLQKQMLDSANVILNADKTLQCIDLIKNPTSHLLGCKLLCNVNLRESGIYGLLIHQYFDVLIESRYDGWRDLKKYRNRVEFKSFNTQYKIYINEVINKFLHKVDKNKYVEELDPYLQKRIETVQLLELINTSLNHTNYIDILFVKTKFLQDVFNIPNLEESITKVLENKINQAGSGLLLFKRTLILHAGHRGDWSGTGSYVSYLYYIENILKCLIEIEQQVTTGNEVVSNP